MEKVRRPNWCAGAITYDTALRERRIKCDKETGDPLVRLCAGCRVIEKLEDQKRKRAILGDESPRSTQRSSPGYGQRTRSTEPRDSHDTPPWPLRRSGSD